MKKLLAVLLAVLMVLSMTACTKGDDTPGEKTTITIWGTWTNAQYEALCKYAEDFTNSQDKYTVVYEGQTYPMDSTLQNAVVANVGPDLIIDYASTAATYHELGKVADLSKYVAKDTIAQLTAGALEEATSYVDDGMYNFPIVLSGPVLWYNPDILAAAGVEVPTTWDELWAAAKTISETVTVVTGEDGSKTFVTDGSGAHIYGFASDSHTDFAETLIKQSGVEIYANGEAAYNDAKVAAILQQYQDGVVNSYLATGPSTDYLSTDFNAGVIAMYYGSVAGEPYMQLNHKAAQVPTVAGGTEWTAAWNRGVVVFDYGNEAKVKGAVAFLEYFVSAEINEDWCEKCNYQSCLKWTMETEAYKNFLASSESLQALQPEIAGALPAIPAQSAIRQSLKNLINEVGSGIDVNTALANAVKYVADNK